MNYKIVLIGSSSGIAQAWIQVLLKTLPNLELHTLSRSAQLTQGPQHTHHQVDYRDTIQIQNTAETINNNHQKTLDLVIVLNGILHQSQWQPEKSYNDLNIEQLKETYEINTIIPSLMGKYFLPFLRDDRKSVFAVLSARIGSISDNKTGGWHAYRASKAALNMIIRNFAIELQRTNKQAIVLGLHPGTVDTPLSKPFQKNMKPNQLFTAEQSANYLFRVITQATTAQSGACFAWDNQEIQP